MEIRIMDAQPDLAESRSIAALRYTRRSLRPRLRRGEALPSWPNRLLEENLWRGARHGLSGELLDLERGVPVPARARLEQLCDWVLPVAEELGAAQWLAIPAANAAERQIARHEEGASMEEIFIEQIRQVSVSEADPLSAEQIVAELQKAKVDEFLFLPHLLAAGLPRLRQAHGRGA